MNTAIRPYFPPPARRVRNVVRNAGCALAVLLAGCGGGGGSSGGGVSAIPTNLTALDSSNAQSVTGAVVQASDTTYNFGKTGTAVVQGVSSTAAGVFSLAKLARWQLLMFKDMESPLSVMGIGNLPAAKAPCDQGQGTVAVINSTVANNSAPAVGDSYAVSFAGCFIKDTQSTLNGSLTMSIVSFNGNPQTDTSWSMTANFKFSNLTSTDPGGTNTFNGGYTFTLTTGDGLTFDGIIQSDSFTQTRGDVVEGLKNLTVNYSVNDTNQTYTLNLHGLFGSTALNGAVNFESQAPFVGSAKDWPSSGKLKLSGANNTSVTLLTVSNNGVQLSIDSTGDGVADDTQNLNWTALVNS